MHRRLIAAIVASALLASHVSAVAAELRMTEPRSFADVQAGVAEVRQSIDNAACGGWTDTPAAVLTGSPRTGVQGDVPRPTIAGNDDAVLPGRSVENPLAAPATGVASRTDFSFPDSAYGYLSACDVQGSDAIVDTDLQTLGIPGVRWQWSGNPDDPVTFVADPDQPGRIEINPYGWCRPVREATPRLCQKLLETLLALSQAVPRPAINTSPDTPSPLCTCPPDALTCPTARVPKHYCFDPATATLPTATGTCDGQACRTPAPPHFTNQLLRCTWGIPQYDADGNYLGQVPSSVSADNEEGASSSFYRHYGGRFDDWTQIRNPNHSIIEIRANDNPNDAWKLRAECYGAYHEADPRDTVMGSADEQCELVILSDAELSPRSPEWAATSEGSVRGERTPNITTPPLPSRPLPRPWVADPSTSLALPDLGGTQNSAALDVLSSLAAGFRIVRQRASATTPPHTRTDTPSDDADRAVGRWWEAQQRELVRLTRDPVTRVLLPPRTITGMADDDPIFRIAQGIVSTSDGTVEATLRAGSDDIGDAIQSLLAAWIAPVEVVPVVAIVPSATLEDITVSIALWRQWAAREERDAALRVRSGGAASKAALAQPVIRRLEEYRERLLQVRTLRSALPKATERLLAVHAKIRGAVQRWYNDNATALLTSAANAVQRRALLQRWREVSQTMLLADASQLLWCANQRYTTPVYSLLDLPEAWWGSAAPGNPRDRGFRPPDLASLGLRDEPDREFDFSDMRVQSSPIYLPRLTLEEVPVHLPIPPLLGADPPSIDTLPPLPPLPDPSLPASPPLPDVAPPPASLITPSVQTVDLARAIVIMDQITTLARRMKASYERLQPSVLTPPDPDQRAGDPRKIIHVENDLRERTVRLFARWLPNTPPDRAGHALRLAIGDTSSPDPACLEDTVCTLPPRTIVSRALWQWFVPPSQVSLRPLLQSLVPSFVQAGVQSENPFTLGIASLRRLVPQDAPVPFPLLPSAPTP